LPRDSTRSASAAPMPAGSATAWAARAAGDPAARQRATPSPLVDLHCHTRASDGSDTPEALVAAAARAGVGVLAVTDHDTLASVEAASSLGRRLGVEVLTGCELTTEAEGEVVHLLAYGGGLAAAGVEVRCAAVRAGRDGRNRAIGQRLKVLTGVGYDDAVALAGEAVVSRAHFARALVTGGVVADVADAFERWLGPGRPAYVAAPSLPVAEAVSLVHAAGGVAVVAHPGRLPAITRDRVLAACLEAGADGLEAWHPQHDLDEQRRWAGQAERRGLLVTGGSDYHGSHKPGIALGRGVGGNVAVPADALVELRARLDGGGR
jgi:predicted metal-dependent phosphoesterase TrpH